jgi:hypothetical protein
MIAKRFGFTRNFLRERNTGLYCRLKKIPGGCKDRARACLLMDFPGSIKDRSCFAQFRQQSGSQSWFLSAADCRHKRIEKQR